MAETHTDQLQGEPTSSKVEGWVRSHLLAGREESESLDFLVSLLQREYSLSIPPEKQEAVKMRIDELTKGIFFDTKNQVSNLPSEQLNMVVNKVTEALQQVANEVRLMETNETPQENFSNAA